MNNANKQTRSTELEFFIAIDVYVKLRLNFQAGNYFFSFGSLLKIATNRQMVGLVRLTRRIIRAESW